MEHASLSGLLSPRSAAPQGAKAAYASYFLAGAGVLAPWNALINAADYWEATFPGRHMDRRFTITYLPTCLVLVALFIRFPRLLSRRLRILTGFAGFTVATLMVPLLDVVFVGSDGSAPLVAYHLLMAVVLAVGLLDGLAQGAVFGDAATMPSEYTHAVVGGTASSGVILSALRLSTKAILPPTRAGLRASTRLYFFISAAITLACFVVYGWVLPRLEVVALWRKRRAAAAAARRAAAAVPHPPGGGGAHGGRRVSLEHGRVGPAAGGDDEEPLMAGHPPLSSSDSAAVHSHAGISSATAAAAGAGNDAAADWRVCFWSVWRLAAAIAVVYAVTLAIFPGVLAEDVRSTDLGDWYGLVLMALFNAADFGGKNLPLPHPVHGPPDGPAAARRHAAVLGFALARVAFLPLFLVALRLGAPAAVIAALCVALGVSNGYLTAMAMGTAHASAPDSATADTVENCLVFCLVLGLFVGALLGWCWIL